MKRLLICGAAALALCLGGISATPASAHYCRHHYCYHYHHHHHHCWWRNGHKHCRWWWY
jgi:hypothetical protein